MKKIFAMSFAAVFAFLLAPQAEAKHVCRCTKELRPVCGVNGKTYSNKCMAGCAHVAVKCAGKCPCKPKACRTFKVKACPKGCKRQWTVKNGCKFPGFCKCKKGPKGVRCGDKRCKPGQKCVKVVCVKAPCPPVCQ